MCDNYQSHMPSNIYHQHHPPHTCSALQQDGGPNACGISSVEQKNWQMHASKNMQDLSRVRGSKPKYYFSRPHKGKNPGALGRLKDVFTCSGADVFVNVRGKERGAGSAAACDVSSQRGCACRSAKIPGCDGGKSQTSVYAMACFGAHGAKILHRASGQGECGLPPRSGGAKAFWTCKDTHDGPLAARGDTGHLKTRFESGSVPWWHDCSAGGHPAAVS